MILYAFVCLFSCHFIGFTSFLEPDHPTLEDLFGHLHLRIGRTLRREALASLARRGHSLRYLYRAMWLCGDHRKDHELTGDSEEETGEMGDPSQSFYRLLGPHMW